HRAIGMSASAPLFLHGLSVPAPGTPIPCRSASFQKRCVSKIAQSMRLHLSGDIGRGGDRRSDSQGKPQAHTIVTLDGSLRKESFSLKIANTLAKLAPASLKLDVTTLGSISF